MVEKKEIALGIMQGRLTPQKGRGIQFFPFDNWKAEFDIAAKIGIDEIEWIFDFENFENNPIWTADGCKEILNIISRTGVYVRTVCWDYFMRRPFYKFELCDRGMMLDENKAIFRRIIASMDRIGAGLIEIPMVDSSSVEEEERKLAIEFIRWCADEAYEYNIDVGLETDFPPTGDILSFKSFLDEIDRPNVYANFDSGNSSGLGYDPYEEITQIGNRIRNVHIKDRLYHGNTVVLGTGSADFDTVFLKLKENGYCRSFILQAARENEGDEAMTISKQQAFVRGYLTKYGFITR